MSEMIDLLKKTTALGIGAALLTKEKIETVVGELVQKGQVEHDVGQKLVSELIKKGENNKNDVESFISDIFSKLIDHTNLAKKKDIESLQDKIANLEKKIQNLTTENNDI